jgi:pSer/pThr/pTyr-binding forkhead associated (FHA) protein
VGPDGVERQLRVEGHPFAIGRGDDNDLVLLDPLVSRHHARLVPRNGRLVLTDLASRNGTRVNGRAVRDAVLGAGDRIEMGSTLVEVLPPERTWTR